MKDSNKAIRIRNLEIMDNASNAFLDITKVADFQWKNTDVSRTQGLCHVTYENFEFSLHRAPLVAASV